MAPWNALAVKRRILRRYHSRYNLKYVSGASYDVNGLRCGPGGLFGERGADSG